MTQPVARLQSAGRVYGVGSRAVEALRPTDLTIEPGDYLAVTGPSGSGKSTLLNLLGLLIRPTSGRVEIGGRETAILDDNEVSRLRGEMLGFVFQSYHLIPHMSVQENVELPLVYARVTKTERKRLAIEALASVRMDGRADAQPTELSGGQRQRVAIARAIIRRPAILLCDEPTGNLDTESSDRIMRLLENMNDLGMTIVLVTHDKSIARRASSRIAIIDGAVNVIESVSGA